MDQLDREQLCSFFRRSRYDLVQTREGDGWGTVWTFPPCDAKAAQNAARMLRRMHRTEPLRVRYARRARVHDRHRQGDTDVVVVTALPERVQEVIGLEDGTLLRVNAFLEDDALAALEAALALPRP